MSDLVALGSYVCILFAVAACAAKVADYVKWRF